MTSDPPDHQPVTPPLQWQGGKRRMLPHLLPLVAARPHHLWVEIFAGGAAVTFAKPPSKMEVINDINNHLVNFYRYARLHREALDMEFRSLIPFARTAFHEARYLMECGTELQRAAAFLLLNRRSFGADNKSYAVRKRPGGGCMATTEALAMLMRAASARLDRVNVECLPWQRCVQSYDAAHTLWFFDPPYIATQAKAYGGFSPEGFATLAAALKGLKGQWILTMGDHPAVRAAMRAAVPAECLVATVPTRRAIAAGNGTTQSTFTELIYASPLR